MFLPRALSQNPAEFITLAEPCCRRQQLTNGSSKLNVCLGLGSVKDFLDFDFLSQLHRCTSETASKPDKRKDVVKKLFWIYACQKHHDYYLKLNLVVSESLH